MKITSLALTAPAAAADDIKVTPELLAAALAKYSRSNQGIDVILANIDKGNPDKTVEAIFKFVDYGHASIGGLTSGIPIAIDGVSLLMAYKLFEFAQQGDGQESSTRYIEMTPASLPTPQEIGIPEHLADLWLRTMTLSLEIYRDLYQELDAQATAHPEIVRIPAGANAKMADRLRKNYALDRARYVLPLALKNNIGLVMTARAWTDVIKQVESLDLLEAKTLAEHLRQALSKYTPRLAKHSHADEASISQASQAHDAAAHHIAHGVPITPLADQVFVATQPSGLFSKSADFPSFLPEHQDVDAAFAGKTNRYSIVGPAIRRTVVRMAWNNIAIAELRDLNRHRTGYRYSPLIPVGFYLPEGVTHPRMAEFLALYQELLSKLVAADATSEGGSGLYLYGLLLGTQTPFEHSTHLDKVIYEIELRTGLGAHFRYADHLTQVAQKLIALHPELTGHVDIGTAEPE